MIRADKLQAELFGGVGFRQPFEPAYQIVDSDNNQSDSGLYFQDANDFVTIQNIKDCQNYKDIEDDDFNDYLEILQKDAILKVCQKVTANESNLIQDVNLYPYEKSFTNTLDPASRFVVFQIEPTKRTDIINKIKWIEICLDSVRTFNIYLYNSNKPGSPIKTQPVTTVANQATIVNITDWFIADDTTHKGGNFYWGYFEDDLAGAKAIKKDYELSDYRIDTQYYCIKPVTMNYSGTTIDVESVTEQTDTFGLNFGMSTYNDYTELLISNQSSLWQCIQYQMAERVLRLIVTSIRSNITERLNKEHVGNINFYLYGDREQGIEGIEGMLKRSIKDLKRTLFYKPLISKATLS
jgi:hypothetical protein